ncbi:MAG TPA: cobalamin-binding protein [Candidatus Dormibacteraeota bacterium]|nr:cobalamin-binding protein [Candidatus Dormibacteraeota bacterium]
MTERIVSLLPSATEIVCSLGLEDQLVGVTHECDYPPSVRKKPVVTASVLDGVRGSGEIDRHIRRMVHAGSSIYMLDSERLGELHPDLILTQELCEVCAVSYPIVERAVRRLDGSTQLVSLEPETLDDVFENVCTVGRLTHRQDRASEVVAGLRDRADVVRRGLAGRPRRRIICLEWVDPPYNCGHWTPELVELAGGEDLLGNAGQPAHPIDAATLASQRPEAIVVMACGFGLERSIGEVERANGTIAAGGAELWVVDGNAYFSRPGPRLVDSLEILGGILHPGLIPAPSAAQARRLA